MGVGIQLDNCEGMSDTESVRGESSEEEMEDLLEEDMKTEIKDEAEDKVSNGETNGIHSSENLKKVPWPPEEEKKATVAKNLPNLSGKVHMGKERRQRMEQEIQNFQGSTVHYSSNPFSQGGFKPGRMRADERWKHQDEDAETKSKMQRPKKHGGCGYSGGLGWTHIIQDASRNRKTKNRLD